MARRGGLDEDSAADVFQTRFERQRVFAELVRLQDEPLPCETIAARLGMPVGSIGPERARRLARLRPRARGRRRCAARALLERAAPFDTLALRALALAVAAVLRWQQTIVAGRLAQGYVARVRLALFDALALSVLGPWLHDRSAAAAFAAHGGTLLGAPARSARGQTFTLVWSPGGHARRHDERLARVGSPRGVGSEGAWELMARWHDLSACSSRGAQVLTLGASWLADHIWCVMLDWHQARSDDDDAVGQTRGQGLALRLQAVL
ncbi:MAG: hypothetical protein RL227_316 [Pseudomonadota bacterium]